MSTTASALQAGTWNIDPSHSRIGFRVKHLGISTVRGEFGDYEGSVVIDADGTVTATGTVKVDSVDTSDEQRDGHLKSADFFDVESHPDISFESTSVTAIDDETREITGDLTMHGVTRPVKLKAEVGGAETDPFGNDRIGLEVTGEISRGDFGMKFNQALGSGNAIVSDKVRLDLDISAVKQS